MRSLRALLGAVLFALSIAISSTAQAPQQRVRTIYVIPSSHWDLGFIAPPEQILPRLKPHIDDVIANCHADPEFRWTIESVWQLREWLARTDDPKQIQALVDLIKKGQIQVSAVFGSMHTEFMSAEQLNRLVYDMKSLEQQYGIKTDFAMMDDVPGFTTRLPQVLARSGITHFVNGSNLFLFGGTSLSPGKVPFYWQSPDGSRILTWQTQSKFGGYTEALADYYIDPLSREPYTKEHFYPKELEGKQPLEIMQAGVDKLLKKYSDAGYPYDAVMLLYLHDFIPPTWERDNLLPSVRAWNAAGKQPRIVVATPAEFFRRLESQKPNFPTYAGDWSGLWSEVKTNSPKITANARWAQAHYPAAETLWTMLTFREATSYPAGNFDSARVDLLKYDEHSGAAQVGWPKLMSRAETDAQNSQYVAYIRDARTDISQLIDHGMQTLFSQKSDATTERNVVVFNPSSWTRDGLITFDSTRSVSIRDLQSNKLLPVQRISPAQLAFLANSVPSLGYKTYAIENALAVASRRAPASTPSLAVENTFYRVEVRKQDGAIIRLLDKQSGVELVDPKSPDKLNSLQRWHWAANFPVSLGTVNITHEDGPLFTRLIVHRPSTMWPETVITLPTNSKRVELSNTLDRSRMPYVASLQTAEYYSFAFPFAFTGSSDVLVDDGTGFHNVPDDYLPGARTDAAAPQQSLILTGTASGKPMSVVLSQRQSFFSYLPGIPGVKDKSKFLNIVKTVALRKQDEGDTRELGMVNFYELEPGLEKTPLQFDYTITSSSSAADAVAAHRAGMELALPLISTQLAPHTSPATPSASFFSIDAPNVTILAFKPSADGDPNHYTLRLQELAGKPATATLSTPLRISEAAETDLTERQVIRPIAVPLKTDLQPGQTLTLRLTIPHETKSRSHRWWEW